MCGIAGIAGHGAGPGRAGEEQVLQLLRHRGPDASGTMHRGYATLFHTRLSIIDTSPASGQPFSYEEQHDALVFNGEIFNYRELAKTLPELRTSGDVEVLYRLLRERGEAALPLLNGFFAFAYFREDGSALLARDRFGVKPLYYCLDDGRLIFASELKGLVALAGARALNGRQLYTYLRLNYCAGRETIFSGVHRLLPGEILSFRNGTITLSQWYQVKKDEATGDLFDLLDDAVRLRLRADVPVGTFLSGGLDSSIVSALAARHQPGLQAFTVGFQNDAYLDESGYAAAVARHIGVKHHIFSLSEDDFLSHADSFLACIDEPFADSSAFNLYMLSMLTRRHVKVALSGDGADELFKGYRKHRALQLARNPVARASARPIAAAARFLPSSRSSRAGDMARKLGKFAWLCAQGPAERVRFLASIAQHDDAAALLAFNSDTAYFESLFGESRLLPDFDSETQFDIAHVLSDDMLVKADRFSMRHGLEMRNPFLDPRVAEYALRLPEKDKISGSMQKIPLRRTFGKLLPEEVLRRPKRGFEIPVHRWLTGALSDRVRNEWLHEDSIHADGIFAPEAVNNLLRQLQSNRPADAPARVWSLIVFRQWMHNFAGFIRHINDRPEVK